jgi:hypothetical protein
MYSRILPVKHPIFASSLPSIFCLYSGHSTYALEVPVLVLQAVRLGLELEPKEVMARIWPSYLLLRLLALQQVFLRQPCALNAEHSAYGLGRRKGIPVRDRSIDAIKSRKGVQVMSVS